METPFEKVLLWVMLTVHIPFAHRHKERWICCYIRLRLTHTCSLRTPTQCLPQPVQQANLLWGNGSRWSNSLCHDVMLWLVLKADRWDSFTRRRIEGEGEEKGKGLKARGELARRKGGVSHYWRGDIKRKSSLWIRQITFESDSITPTC